MVIFININFLNRLPSVSIRIFLQCCSNFSWYQFIRKNILPDKSGKKLIFISLIILGIGDDGRACINTTEIHQVACLIVSNYFIAVFHLHKGSNLAIFYDVVFAIQFAHTVLADILIGFHPEHIVPVVSVGPGKLMAVYSLPGLVFGTPVLQLYPYVFRFSVRIVSPHLIDREVQCHFLFSE